MFTTDNTWAQAPSLQSEFLRRRGQTQYKAVEVPLDAALFYVYSSEVNEDGFLDEKRYCLTTLANTLQFLSTHQFKRSRLFGLIAWQGHLELVEMYRIIMLSDTQDFENLFFECSNGVIYLDGIGVVENLLLDGGNVLWSCSTGE